jgi:hypothetical protein
MKLFSSVLAVSLVASVSTAHAFPNPFKRHKKKKDPAPEIVYQPLAGSEWAQDTRNVGQLPYDHCEITAEGGLGSEHFFSGLNPEQVGNADLVALVCTSDALKLKFAIPVNLRSYTTVGTFALGSSDENQAMTVSGLDGHTIGDLYGTYRGGRLGIGLYRLGFYLQWLEKDGIQVKDKAGGVKIGWDTGYVDFNLEERKEISELLCGSKYALVKDAAVAHTAEDCKKQFGAGGIPGYPMKPQVNMDQIRNLRFVHVDKPKKQ